MTRIGLAFFVCFACLGGLESLAAAVESDAPVVPGTARLGKGASVEHGLILLGELNCVSCHDAGPRGAMIVRKPAPDLTHVGARVNPGYLERFIANPAQVKPGTTMPQVMGRLDDEGRRRAATAIAHFLRSLSDKPFVQGKVNPASAKRGGELFNTIGCVACHQPRDAKGNEQPLAGSVPLGSLWQKYSLDSLASFLNDPLAVRAGGRMPGMHLSPWEARDIASFLMQGGDAATARPVNKALAATGRKQFAELGCVNCHRIKGIDAQRKAPALRDLKSDRGCLSALAGAAPRYPLTAAQRDAIRAAIAAPVRALSPTQRIERTLVSLNCVACHQRGKLGGITAERQPFFACTNENLGEQGRIPPALTGVGAKLQAAWLRKLLVLGETVRPYMKTRMPQFGKDNVLHLVKLFGQVDEPITAPPAIKHPNNRDAIRAVKNTGRTLVGDQGANCVACHTFKGEKPPAMPAMDLSTTTDRLRRPWLYAFLLSPQRFYPSTVMPTFWPDGKSTRADILNGDTNQQIDAIWNFLSDGREAGIPRGLVHEPLIIKVEEEAVMLRRQYAGVGKRGIGVGYPAGVNLVFDAEQMRLAELWRGGFLDVGGVWRGQGAGSARPLERQQVRFPAGSALAVLSDSNAAWPAKTARQMNIRFKGYTLDDKRRPRLAYRIGDIAVTDYFLDIAAKADAPASFRRTLTFESPRKTRLVLRAAADSAIEITKSGGYRIGKSLRLTVDGAARGVIVEQDKVKELRLPIDLSSGKTTVTIEYHW